MVKIFIVFCYLNNFLTAKLRIFIQKWCHTGYDFVVSRYNFVVTGYKSKRITTNPLGCHSGINAS